MPHHADPSERDERPLYDEKGPATGQTLLSATTRGATPGGTPGSALSAWEVNAAATDLNAAQDPGGRITQFSLRFSW